ncbi:MAG: MgtC/SapB family protein [Eubacteriales bacterium]|nr:MgtC/SapB family protein [Eubacteriales bacterium]
MNTIGKAWDSLIDLAAGWGTAAILIRMFFSLLVGMLIGIDRGLKRRGAGIKTHVMVCLGSALVMMTSQYITLTFDAKTDLARMGAQVISGVGFLGVGTIMVTGKNQVRGLTTAAGLWACACIGLAIGIGFIEGAIITLCMILLTLQVLSKIDIQLQRYARVFDLYIEFDTNKSISAFLQEMHEWGVKVGTLEMSKSKLKGEGPNAIVNIEMKKRMERPQLLNNIRDLECVRYVEEL